MIVNIRGTSGSGKSTLVRMLMGYGKNTEPLLTPESKVEGYKTYLDFSRVNIVGRYETACGGCDTIKTQALIEERINRFSTTGSVVFEGLLISVLHSRYRDLARRWNDAYQRTKQQQELVLRREVETFPPFVFAFLDTPLDVCVERVLGRRKRAGNDKPFDSANTEDKWRTCRVVADKFRADGLPVVELDHRDPLPGLLTILKGAL